MLQHLQAFAKTILDKQSLCSEWRESEKS